MYRLVGCEGGIEDFVRYPGVLVIWPDGRFRFEVFGNASDPDVLSGAWRTDPRGQVVFEFRVGNALGQGEVRWCPLVREGRRVRLSYPDSAYVDVFEER